MRGPLSPHQNRESPMNRNLTIQTWRHRAADPAVADSVADDQRRHRRPPAAARRRAEDIARSSSYSQRLSGPVMVVPYRKTVRDWKLNEKPTSATKKPAKSAVVCISCRSVLNSTARCKPNCVRGAFTRRGCSTPTTASMAISRCRRNWASTKTSPITVRCRRFWRWASAIFAASKTR